MKFKLVAFSGGHGMRRNFAGLGGFGKIAGAGAMRGLAKSGAGMAPGILLQGALPQVTPEAEEFFELVFLGDVEKLNAYIQTQHHFDVNCKNHQGYTGLVLAVKANDVPMVTYLLSFDYIQLGEALLHAAQGGNEAIVQILLDHKGFHHAVDLTVGVAVDSPEFDLGMTPLIVAAHFDHYHVIQLLLMRGHVIEKPHPPHCFCVEKCHKKILGESLHDSNFRYNLYKAISSAAYICQTSEDPILTAFLLSHELDVCGRVERELQEEYVNLSQQVSDFAVSLLDQCRTTEEVSMILQRHTKTDEKMVKAATKYERFSRLALAIDYNQKSFVAHPNCQNVLRSTWLEGFQDWRQLSVVSKCLILIPRIIFLPLLAVIYLVSPTSSWSVTWRCPLNKFINFSASYMMFLIMLFVQTSLDFSDNSRGPPSTGLEWPIMLYVFGLIWLNFKIFWKHGLRHYCNQDWGIYDMVMLCLFMGTFLSWFVAYLDVSLHGNKHLPRQFWHQFDPTLVGEAFFAFSFILAYGKLLCFLQMANKLGPMQISMGRMISDIMNFLLVFLLTMLAFSVGLVQLYQHYTGQVRTVNGTSVAMSTSFSSLGDAYAALYWSIYGYSPPVLADVILKEHYIHYRNQTISIVNAHRLTEIVGHFMFGTYYVVGIIIMVNMLIAMMSTSFSIVQENALLEWKFARTKVWMSYFDRGSTLPPPFNIIPSPKSVWHLIQWAIRCYCGDHRAKYSRQALVVYCACYFWAQRCCYFEEGEKTDEAEDSDYMLLMAQLIQRYLISQMRHRDFIPATMADMEPLHHQLKDLRLKIKQLKKSLAATQESTA